MTRLAVLALAALLCAVGTASACPTVLRIDVLDREQRLLRRANAVIDHDGRHALTVAHVLDGAAKIRWHLPSGRQPVARADPPDAIGDGIVRLPAPRLRAHSRTITATVPNGAPIRVLGNLVQMGAVVLKGTAGPPSRHPLLRGARELSAPLSEGLSGAAIVDEQCRLVGLAAFGLWSVTGQQAYFLPLMRQP
ncbi:MAG: serine protease [Candidatus Dadabacteria bacterium]|nr:MAG: serine protease [Candidatus Dadabacteria bacterium]